MHCDSQTCPVKSDPSLRFCPECGRKVEAQAASDDPMVGRVIANTFRLEKAIGEGAMGTIYRAEQISLQKAVVIKLLHRHLAGDPTLAKRFHREAKAASLLNHPNCITIIDFGQTEDQILYIAMEFINGVDLAELVYAEHPLDPKRIINILKQTCTALDEAHANGVLHRDLKPENIMITERRHSKDFVKVLDFGIAKLQESSPGGPGTFQTMAGVVCGTPEYMSPEQARGEKLDGRSDLYSIGIMLYQMLTNTVPFEADSPLGVVTQHLSKIATPPSEVYENVHPGLERLAASLMEKKREARPPTALDVVAELERCEREIEASRAANARVDDDRTIIEIRPSQLAELEQARKQYQQKVTAARLAAQSGDVPVKAREQAAPIVEGQAPRSSTEVVMLSDGGAYSPEPIIAATGSQTSNAKLWIITIIVAILVAVGGFFGYKAVAGAVVEDAPLVEPGTDTEPTPTLLGNPRA